MIAVMFRCSLAPVDSSAGATLLREYYREMVARYHRRPADEAEVDAALAADPSHDLPVFVVGYAADEPAGCVGLRVATAEIKRMYVRPAFRGRGLGGLLLDAVEREAVERGLPALRMDTRHDLVEARGLYTKHGYAEIPAYNDGPYAEHWFEKRLPPRASG